jgi:hypothetical protein
MIMKCISPLSVPIDGDRKNRRSVPCGKCIYCLETKRADWTFRLKAEMDTAFSAFFVTLTYNSKYLPVNERLIPQLNKEHCQLFIKRLRNAITKRVQEAITNENVSPRALKQPSMRYFLVGEYGTNKNRPHYHAILFNVPPKIIENLDHCWVNYLDENKKESLGFVDVAPCNMATIHYTTKYILDKHKDFSDRTPPFSLMSRRPGLGHNYTLKKKKYHNKSGHTHVVNNGFKQAMPRYFKEKIFDKMTREEIGFTNEMEAKNKQIKEEIIARNISDDPLKYLNDLQDYRYRLITKRSNKKRKL